MTEARLQEDFDAVRQGLIEAFKRPYDAQSEQREIKQVITWKLVCLCAGVWAFNTVGFLFFPQPPSDHRIYYLSVLVMLIYAGTIWAKKLAITNQYRASRAEVDQLCQDMYDDARV